MENIGKFASVYHPLIHGHFMVEKILCRQESIPSKSFYTLYNTSWWWQPIKRQKKNKGSDTNLTVI